MQNMILTFSKITKRILSQQHWSYIEYSAGQGLNKHGTRAIYLKMCNIQV